MNTDVFDGACIKGCLYMYNEKRCSITDLTASLGIQNKSNDHAVETQYFSKNQNQNNSNEKSGLQHELSDTFVAHNANSVAGSQTSKANTKTTGQMHKAVK